MKYKAYLETTNAATGQLTKIRVFPRSKKETAFSDIKKAETRLAQLTRNNSFNSRGIVCEFTAEGKEVLTIAL